MRQSILIRNVLLGKTRSDVRIADARFESIRPSSSSPDSADIVIDGSSFAILPPFSNTHTHAAMSLLRGYADDMPLQKWLTEYIWPYEAKLSSQDIRNGSSLAVREMIKSGSVMFNDMYWDIDQTIDIVDRAGIRALIGVTIMDYHTQAQMEEKIRFIREFKDPTGGRIKLAVAPHAIYTVGKERLRESAELARNHGLKLHIHLSETRKEVDDCIAEHGMTPVEYLDSIGFLGPDVIAAHCVWLDRNEWDLLAERGVVVSHCPCSNMKLGSGRFNYEDAIASGALVTLGTDGDSSNNNLDMREEMKFASLLAKVSGDPALLPAEQVLSWATSGSRLCMGVDSGEISEGKVADAILVNMDDERMTPCHHLISNWVYSAQSSLVDTVICEGKILMRGGELYV